MIIEKECSRCHHKFPYEFKYLISDKAICPVCQQYLSRTRFLALFPPSLFPQEQARQDPLNMGYAKYQESLKKLTGGR